MSDGCYRSDCELEPDDNLPYWERVAKQRAQTIVTIYEEWGRLRSALTQIREAGNDSEQSQWMQKVAAYALEPDRWPAPGEQPLL